MCKRHEYPHNPYHQNWPRKFVPSVGLNWMRQDQIGVGKRSWDIFNNVDEDEDISNKLKKEHDVQV